MHIAIAGNIGSGKTTLTSLLAKHFAWEAHYEDVETNPYLHSFYEDMQRWSFNLQIYFLNSRFRQIVEIRKSGKDVIQDRTIYEDAYIFAPNLHSMGLMSTRDFENYFTLFNMISSLLEPPDLKRLNERYEAWIESYNLGKILIVDADNHNFPESTEDLSMVIDKVNAELHGLF